MDGEGIVNSMVTCNMFEQPVFKDGALRDEVTGAVSKGEILRRLESLRD